MTNAAIADQIPYLRRYARALTGSQTAGDAAVHDLLQALVTGDAQVPPASTTRLALFTLFHQMLPAPELDSTSPTVTSSHARSHERTAMLRFDALPPIGRQLLLLTALENFSMDHAASIVGLPLLQAQDLLAAARAEIDRQTRTSILIIEDEPLIAMELEVLVHQLGHEVLGNASTRTQAAALFASGAPGLVLADIQLADGSSGIDAVRDMLASHTVPVIFITAFPERLLTSERPEPTYLITKPFEARAVQVAISQALFFNSTARL